MSLGPLWQKIREYADLSEYESKIYASLINEGPSTARRLSMLCGVPRTKMYAALRKLIEREMVTEVPSSPKRFTSLPPTDAFEPFLRTLEEKTRDFYALISALEENYVKTLGSAEMKRVETWVLLGRTRILQKISEMMMQAEKFVDIVTTENGLILFYKTYGVLLDRLGKDGLEIRITAPISPKNENIARELRYVCKVRHNGMSPPVLLSRTDNDQFLLARMMPDDYEMSSDNDVGMFCRSPILCNLMIQPFLGSIGPTLKCNILE